jgi:hypothetical protein
VTACPRWWHHQADPRACFSTAALFRPFTLLRAMCGAAAAAAASLSVSAAGVAWLLLLSKLAALHLIGCLPALAVQLTKCCAACCCLGPACASCGQPLVQPHRQRRWQAWALALLLLRLTRSTLTPTAASTSTRRCSATRCGAAAAAAAAAAVIVTHGRDILCCIWCWGAFQCVLISYNI